MLRIRGGGMAETKRCGEEKPEMKGMRLGKDGTVQRADRLAGGGRTGMGERWDSGWRNRGEIARHKEVKEAVMGHV